ncbi:ulp1 protease family, C-terminal catalytic domain-containing protein [Artemisia annua]|uniref:Ulp1 protease family, C-terminal catalytic domain-containing protein n=1 Tax=Artemisia annua TaxID=35608 RepID=A0A2U1KX42_ARTAN|nr:ulp1 protease family, C-terminal catalytic domain-containing protein [Artemisia annua]
MEEDRGCDQSQAEANSTENINAESQYRKQAESTIEVEKPIEDKSPHSEKEHEPPVEIEEQTKKPHVADILNQLKEGSISEQSERSKQDISTDAGKTEVTSEPIIKHEPPVEIEEQTKKPHVADILNQLKEGSISEQSERSKQDISTDAGKTEVTSEPIINNKKLLLKAQWKLKGKGIIDDAHSSGKRKYNRKPKNPKVDKIFEDSDSEKTIDVEDSNEITEVNKANDSTKECDTDVTPIVEEQEIAAKSSMEGSDATASETIEERVTNPSGIVAEDSTIEDQVADDTTEVTEANDSTKECDTDVTPMVEEQQIPATASETLMGNSNMKGKDVEKSMDERVTKPCEIVAKDTTIEEQVVAVAEDTTIEEQVVAGKQQDTEIDAESSFKEDEPKADNITDKTNEEKTNEGRTPTQDSAQNEDLVSPYQFTSVNPKMTLSKVEQIVSGTLYAMTGPAWEPIFERARRLPILYHFDMETIMPKLEISSNVIDIWSEILNVMELYKEDTRLPSRYFFKISLINPLYYIEKHSDEEKLQSFTKSVDDSFADDEKDLKTLETFDILFFPICRESHLYLICADFKNGSFRVIDNSSNGTDFKERYQSIPEEIRKVLVAYLDQVKNQKVERIRNAKPTRMQMKWRTKNNHVDCGVFLMLHMETYHGLMNWECGLFSESDKQKRQLNLLRAKYATKILLSELNLIKNKFLKLVQAFEKKSEDERRKMIEYAIAHRNERERGE